LSVALCATNTIRQQLIDKIAKIGTNSSGIYKLKCNTNSSYVGQLGRSVATRYKEHTQRYKEHTQFIRTHNLI